MELVTLTVLLPLVFPAFTNTDKHAMKLARNVKSIHPKAVTQNIAMPNNVGVLKFPETELRHCRREWRNLHVGCWFGPIALVLLYT